MRVKETTIKPGLGWFAGDKDTYYSVQVYRYSDDDPWGVEETANTLAGIRAIIAHEKRQNDHEHVTAIVRVNVTCC